MKHIILLLLIILTAVATFVKAQDSSSFYALDQVQRIKIKTDSTKWRYLLDSLRYNGDELLTVDVSINGSSFDNVGLRYRDTPAWSPGSLRNSLHLQLDHSNPKAFYRGRQAVKLSAAVRDPSLVRETLGYEIAGKYFPAPRANYAYVEVNKEAYGVLVNIEPIDTAFLNRNFGASDGYLYLSQPNTKDPAPSGCISESYGSLQYDKDTKCFAANFLLLRGSSYRPLVNLTRALEQDIDHIEDILDVDEVLWMLAFNNVAVNLSSYTGKDSPNYMLYQDVEGVFHPILWDMNLAFGSYKNTGKGSDLKFEELVEMDPLLHLDNQFKPLISRLLAKEEYRKLYLSHLRTLVYEEFENDSYLERAKAMQESIRSFLEMDDNRYYQISQFDDSLKKTIGSKSQIPGIQELMEPRADFLRKHPELTIIPPSIANIKVKKRERFSTERVENFSIQAQISKFVNRVKIYYRFSPDETYRSKNMVDDGKHFDEEANDHIYGVIIDPPNGRNTLQYYIMAENAKLMTFDPVRYMSDYHETTLEEIN